MPPRWSWPVSIRWPASSRIYVKFGAVEQLHWIAYIAAFTAFYAAAVACAQADIKRGLAFSTISQIAYMLVALGVCFALDNHHGGLGYMAAMFHLFTHAMFKALLFLCSGAIIVIVGSNFYQYMGGLRKYMPITNVCFLIGCLAIAGIPPFSGFFSKDEIIAACFQFSPFLGWFMTVVAGMTAFYMFRLYYLIFWGKSYYEADPDHRRRPQEVPFVMWGPLVFLAIISVFAGLIPFGHFVSATGESYDIHIDWSVATTEYRRRRHRHQPRHMDVRWQGVARRRQAGAHLPQAPQGSPQPLLHRRRMAVFHPQDRLPLLLPSHRLVRPSRRGQYVQLPGLGRQ